MFIASAEGGRRATSLSIAQTQANYDGIVTQETLIPSWPLSLLRTDVVTVFVIGCRPAMMLASDGPRAVTSRLAGGLPNAKCQIMLSIPGGSVPARKRASRLLRYSGSVTSR